MGVPTEKSHRRDQRIQVTVFFGLILSGIAIRILCRDLPNFAPVAALALFAGYYFRSQAIAACVPIAILAVSNVWFGGYGSWLMTLAVFGCFTIPVVLGHHFLVPGRDQRSLGLNSKEPKFARLLASTLFGSCLFFFVSNYAAWIEWYPRTWEGWIACYWAAIPFFRYTLAGDFFFCFSCFGAYALALRVVAQPHESRLVGLSVGGTRR